jgi:hypothetical protein
MKTILPGQRVKLIETDGRLIRSPELCENQYHPVVEPKPHLCLGIIRQAHGLPVQCGRPVVWDEKCLKCSMEYKEA